MKVTFYTRHSFLIFCLVTTIFSYALFLKCYFPLKQGLPGHAHSKDVPPEPVSGRNGVPTPKYRRLVLMVVDALRTDFVLGDIPFMTFTKQLLRDGSGVSFSARTHLPTVTLPRIKAMTTGSIPGFVDVVLNFGSSALTEDNVLTQLKQAGKTLTFFGDDTWLRLFPQYFTRADGTTSFFVTDYTEVDTNVTRHLEKELAAEDWDVMVLHYLGLDHLGHLYAPEPSLFMPKLQEMDAVVQQIYTAITSWDKEKPALLVLTGDHGVSDQGGHGGASPEETGVPIVLLSPHTPFQPPHETRPELQQIDLCPTLSALLGLPIPRNNLGRVEVTALPLNTPLEDQVRHLQLNAAQMVAVLEQNVGSLENDPAFHLYEDALSAHSSWLSSRNSTPAASWEAVGSRVLMGYQDAVRRMSERIGQTSTSYDMYGIGVAIACLWMCLLLQTLGLASQDAADSSSLPRTGSLVMALPLLVVAILSHVTLCTSHHRSDILCRTSIPSVIVQLVTLTILCVAAVQLGRLLPFAGARFWKKLQQPRSIAETALTGGVAVHALSLLSSSFVEEEHQTWYFFVSSFHVLLLLLFFPSLPLSSPTSGGLAASEVELSSYWCRGGDGVSESERCREVGSDPLWSEGNDVQRESVVGDKEEWTEKRGDRSRPQQGSKRRDIQWTLSLLGILVLCRILRRWNQTGNKWLDVPDVGDWLVRPENKPTLSLVVAVSFSCMALTRAGSMAGKTKRSFLLGGVLCVYLSKAAAGSLLLPEMLTAGLSAQGVVEARLAYVFILCLMVHCLMWPHSTASPHHHHHLPAVNSTNDTSSPSPNQRVSPSVSTNQRISPSASTNQKISPSASTNQNAGYVHPPLADTRESCLHQQNNSLHVPSSAEEADDTLSSCEMRERHKGLWEGMQAMWLCVMCLLLRPHNVAQVVMMSLVEKLACDYVLPSVGLRAPFLLLYSLMMGQATFFFQGNSNSLSTVDVSAGLTALFDYQPFVIGLQIAMATYAGIFFWLLSALKFVTMATPLSNFRWRLLSEAYTQVVSATLVTRALPLAIYTVLVTLMRYHLFVWTVFSPKLLYEGTLTLALAPFCLGSLLLACAVRNTGKEKL